MTIDFWGLGLQAINVLILIWLLSRVLWRPLVAAIAKRQETTQSIIKTAKDTQAAADAVLADVTKARARMAVERTALLDTAKREAEAASNTTLVEARNKAEEILEIAKNTISHDTKTAQKANESHASDVSLKIAARLLERLNSPLVQSAFLPQLLSAIADMPVADRKALAADPKGIEILTPAKLGPEQDKIKSTVQKALGGTPKLRFSVDPDLIAGLELRSPHFVLHNSWQSDLAQVQKAVKDGA